MSKNKTECCDKNHPNHAKELPRLNKIAGQIGGIQKMIEEKRYCVDILQQLSSVNSAVRSLQANILESHLSECVQETFALKNKEDIDEKISEIKEIFKKYHGN